MPSIFRKDGKKKELIKNLGNIYQNIQREQQISPGDFPEIKKMQVNINIPFLNLILSVHNGNWHNFNYLISYGCNYLHI